MTPPNRILLIEDDSVIALSLKRVLEAEGWEVVLAGSGTDGLKLGNAELFELIITDIRLPGLDGLELTQQLHRAKPRMPILVMTAHGTTETAIEAMKFGAFEYLLKPFEMDELLDLARKAINAGRLMSGAVTIGESTGAEDALIGQSRAMQEIFKEIGRVAAKPVNVLVRGETGTGKELVARALYQHSGRSGAPFVAVNCAAIPETMLESELFGHERGAFTGAEARRIGRFEQASGGTLFLDEIGDLSPGTQVKLLRVLQERIIHRLGGKESVPTDVRIIAATHRDLEAMMRARQFREDLYYRLNVVMIQLPPLRERAEDIPELVRYFLRKHGADLGHASPAIQPEALEILRAQPWPGNVRELENVVRKALLDSRGFTIEVEHIWEPLARPSEPGRREPFLRKLASDFLQEARNSDTGKAYARFMELAERELLSQAIEDAQGNQAKAARWLGVSRLTLREKLRQYGRHPAAGEQSPET